jgi:NADP-dependent 3-hydroxy acid dehydrogenase YdfG
MDQRLSPNGKRLSNKVAIITGATGGIGEATAKLFLAEGASVMLVGRSPDKLREPGSGLELANDSITLLPLPLMKQQRRLR